MTKPLMVPKRDDSLLDVVVVLAESWRLLVIGPLVVAILVFGAMRTQPRLYTSHAVVALYPKDLIDITSKPVIDAALAGMGDHGSGSGLSNSVRQGLEVSGTNPPFRFAGDDTTYDALTYVGGSTKISLSYPDRDRVRLLLDRVLQVYDTQIGAERLAAIRRPLDQQIAALDRAAENEETALRSMQSRLSGNSAVAAGIAANVATAVGALSGQIARNRTQAAALTQLRERLPKQLILSPPSPAQAEGRDPAILAAIASAILAGCLLAVFVLARAAIRATAADPISRDRVERIRRAFSPARRNGSNKK